MTRELKNPFQYGKVVIGEYFCNRIGDIGRLSNHMMSSENVWLYSPRRYGKTSLLNACSEKLGGKAVIVYIDLFPTRTANDFLKLLAKTTAHAAASRTEKLLEIARSFFSRLAPAVRIDDDGKPVLTFGVNFPLAEESVAAEILDIPQRIAETMRKPVVVVFDEFQEIANYPESKWQHTLRSHIQTHKDVSYIFAGSQKSMMSALFESKRSPLFNSATHFNLGAIPLNEFGKFIKAKFAAGRKKIQEGVIKRIYESAQANPHYIQYYCNIVWDMTTVDGIADETIFSASAENLMAREEKLFMNIIELLTINQRNVLIALANLKEDQSILSSPIMSRYGLGSISGTRAVLMKLEKIDILERTGRHYDFTNPVFKQWLIKKYDI